jgi:hypothetical protein
MPEERENKDGGTRLDAVGEILQPPRHGDLGQGDGSIQKVNK